MRKTLALTLFVLLVPQRVHAGPSANCLATEILASNDGKGIDRKLAHLGAQLKRPPFSAWNTFQWLATRKIKAQKATAVSVPLLPPGKLTLMLQNVVVLKGKSRFRIAVTIDYKKRAKLVSTVLTFDSGKTLFPFSGVRYKKGTYVIALACK